MKMNQSYYYLRSSTAPVGRFFNQKALNRHLRNKLSKKNKEQASFDDFHLCSLFCEHAHSDNAGIQIMDVVRFCQGDANYYPKN